MSHIFLELERTTVVKTLINNIARTRNSSNTMLI